MNTLFIVFALALPPNRVAIIREFETFMRHTPGYEFYIQFDQPPEAKSWERIPFLYRSYRVFARKLA